MSREEDNNHQVIPRFMGEYSSDEIMAGLRQTE